jgi:cobalt-precorrin-5B (C1)-methyltransferase
MIRNALAEVLDTDDPDPGFDVEVGCENGDVIAQKTFNPRLGIIGGISILGTTGIVEPKSLASFKASIEVYLRVALGNAPYEIVLSPGNLGQRFARAALQLPLQQIVQTSNFLGFALDALNNTLEESSQSLQLLWIVGHPGKLAKILCDHWDTHSSQGINAMEGLIKVAMHEHPHFVELLSRDLSTEACIESLRTLPGSTEFWNTVERNIGSAVIGRTRNVGEVRVKLFSMEGTPLGERQ